MKFVWHGRVDSDWFEVWVLDEEGQVPWTRIFVGHPEDFWAEFIHYARKYGFVKHELYEEVV